MKWISVKDRLPEVNVFVLCIGILPFKDDMRGQFVACMTTTYKLNDSYHERPCHSFSIPSNGCWLGLNEVTHWMPLPKGPHEVD